MQNKKGFLARQFRAAVVDNYVLSIRKKLAALGLVLPAVAVSGNVVPLADASGQSYVPAETPKTLYSQNVEKLNAQFNRAGPYNRILFIDRDNILERSVQKQNMLPPEAVRKSVEEYLRDVAGIQPNDQIIRILLGGIQGGGGLALPVSYQSSDGVQGGMCLIVGQNPDTSARAQQDRMLGVYPGLHDKFIERQPGQTLSHEIHKKLTDYHELGHCMDQWYLKKFTEPGVITTVDDIVKARHQTEVFGEVFGLLMLAREGYTDIAEKRADHRLINLLMNGSLFAQRAPWEAPEKYFGYMYALHEAIQDTQRSIERIGVESLKNMDLNQISDLAHQITEDEALSHDGADWAITFMLTNKFDLSTWDRMRHEYPHVEEAYQIAIRVREKISDALIRVYGADAFDPSKPVWTQINMTPEDIRRSAPMGEQERDWIIRSVQSSIIRAAGGPESTETDVIRAAMREKDRLRSVFEQAQDGSEQKDAMIRLILIHEATYRAIRDIRNRPISVPGGEVLRPAA